MNCEMCGKQAELYTATIEGINLKVCERCAGHGKIIAKAKPKIIPRKIKRAAIQKPVETELVEAVLEDFAKRIRDARTKAGMTQKEFAKKINEKESLLHKMETGSFIPSIPTAKKLEKVLKIKLTEQREEEKVVMPKTGKGGAMTIGDILKI
ncbi:multiprotein bridging factor aMBF1 [Candidatus Woesearchaeota archaeon]|nr:multiprotein bridging factor aMBF1 [Candidatus Woesearchaeota archaeon]